MYRLLANQCGTKNLFQVVRESRTARYDDFKPNPRSDCAQAGMEAKSLVPASGCDNGRGECAFLYWSYINDTYLPDRCYFSASKITILTIA